METQQIFSERLFCYFIKEIEDFLSYNPGQKSWDTFARTLQNRASHLHPLCNVDLKGPSHPESLQALSTLLGVGGGRAVTKAMGYKQSNRLTQGIFHKCPILHVFLPGVARTFGQDCSFHKVMVTLVVPSAWRVSTVFLVFPNFHSCHSCYPNFMETGNVFSIS